MKSSNIYLLLLFFCCQIYSQNIYKYDNLNRLSQVTYANGTIINYTFDELGNLLTRTSKVATVSVVVITNPTAGGSVTGAGNYAVGQSCTLVATANTGYSFVNWTENGTIVSTTASYTFSVAGARTLVANFVQNTLNYTISSSASPVAGGSITGSGTYTGGASCTLKATANTGYTFVNWTESGTQVSTSASYVFTVSNNRSLVANFSQSPVYYSITTSASPTSGGTTSGGGTVLNGTTQTIVATPNSGYTFVNWTENGAQVSTSASYTFTVSGNRTLVANFSVSSIPSPATPNTPLPADGSSGQPIAFTLNWSSAFTAGTVSHDLYISTSSSFSTKTLYSGSGTTQAISGLANGTTYYWKVISYGSNGTTSSWSPVWSFTTQGNQIDLSAGLVAYYPFNGNTNDMSGNGNNGTDLVGGVSFVTGRYDQAVKFNGYSNPGHIHVPNSTSLQFTNGASFVYWVRLDDAAGMDGWGRYSANGNQCTFAKSHDRSGIYNNMSYSSQSKLYTGLGSRDGGGIGSRVQGISDYIIGSWIQIAYSCSNLSSTLYVNGIQDTTVNTPVNFSTSNTQDLYFGKYSDYWYPFNGALDEMRIYNRALSATEIQQLYNNNPTGLINLGAQLSELHLYPNPTQSFLKISSSEIIERIEVCDIAGRVIDNITISANSYSLDVNSLLKGIYLIKGFTNMGVVTSRFIKE
ncbi:MAG: LamG-like jellyroll fold domain-containing protein [Paludibacter sp.]